MKISRSLTDLPVNLSQSSVFGHTRSLYLFLLITIFLFVCYFYMGGGSSKADMAAPIIVKETERHLATVSEYYLSALVTPFVAAESIFSCQ